MPKVRITLAARKDLEDILYFSIVSFGESVAWQYRSDLDAAILKIGDGPRIGRPYRTPHRTYLRVNCRSHGIFYTMNEEEVTVVRVLHLAMDFMRHLPR